MSHNWVLCDRTIFQICVRHKFHQVWLQASLSSELHQESSTRGYRGKSQEQVFFTWVYLFSISISWVVASKVAHEIFLRKRLKVNGLVTNILKKLSYLSKSRDVYEMYVEILQNGVVGLDCHPPCKQEALEKWRNREFKFRCQKTNIMTPTLMYLAPSD